MPILIDPYDPPATSDRASTGTLPQLTLSRGDVALVLDYTSGLHVLPGVEGLDEPPRRLLTADPATWDGSMFRDVFYQPREIFLPLALIRTDTTAMRASLRGLTSLLDPKRGPVVLTVAHSDGTVRYIEGYTAKPAAEALSVGEGRWWRTLGVTLLCPDPYFFGPAQTATWHGPQSATEFLGPHFLPMQLGTSQVGGYLELDNAGDADTYPVWTIVGPGTDLTVTRANLTWSIPDGVDAGETMTVDTRPGSQAVTVAGVNEWARLARDSVLWPIPPSDPAATFAASVTMTSATADSRVIATWWTRWLTAW